MKPVKIRRLAALIVLLFFTAVFLASGPAAAWLRRLALAATQISPSLARNGWPSFVFPLAIILLLAFLAGRAYCSALCPAGLLQELFHRIGAALRLSRLKFRPARPFEAVFILSVTAGLALLAGSTWLVGMLDPLGLFGGLLLTVFPAAEAYPNWEETLVSIPFALSAALLIIVPLFKGRWFCDRLCPMGALLSLAADPPRWRRLEISRSACRGCRVCEKVCQTRCLDAEGGVVDAARCVLCLDCLSACKFSAVAFAKPVQSGRRSALAGVASGAAFLMARRLNPLWSTPLATLGVAVTPPGSMSHARHSRRCVTCQACVPACPMGVISSAGRADRRPVLDFNRGFCQYDCFACRDACPAGAFRKSMGMEEKKRIRIARNSLRLERCVVVARGEACGACAEICPTHAVIMAAPEGGGEDAPTLPNFQAGPCIGCGACYHVCPAEPRAFLLEPLEVHEIAEGVRYVHEETAPGALNGDAARDSRELTDFPF